MELPQCNIQTPVYSYTRTELLSLTTKTVDRLIDLDIMVVVVVSTPSRA